MLALPRDYPPISSQVKVIHPHQQIHDDQLLSGYNYARLSVSGEYSRGGGKELLPRKKTASYERNKIYDGASDVEEEEERKEEKARTARVQIGHNG